MAQHHTPEQFALAWQAAATASPTSKDFGENFTRTVYVEATPERTKLTSATAPYLVVRSTLDTLTPGEDWSAIVQDTGGRVGQLAANAKKPTDRNLFAWENDDNPTHELLVFPPAEGDPNPQAKFKLFDGQPHELTSTVIRENWPATDRPIDEFKPSDRTGFSFPAVALPAFTKVVKLLGVTDRVEQQFSDDACLVTIVKDTLRVDVWIADYR